SARAGCGRAWRARAPAVGAVAEPVEAAPGCAVAFPAGAAAPGAGVVALEFAEGAVAGVRGCSGAFGFSASPVVPVGASGCVFVSGGDSPLDGGDVSGLGVVGVVAPSPSPAGVVVVGVVSLAGSPLGAVGGCVVSPVPSPAPLPLAASARTDPT